MRAKNLSNHRTSQSSYPPREYTLANHTTARLYLPSRILSPAYFASNTSSAPTPSAAAHEQLLSLNFHAATAMERNQIEEVRRERSIDTGAADVMQREAKHIEHQAEDLQSRAAALKQREETTWRKTRGLLQEKSEAAKAAEQEAAEAADQRDVLAHRLHDVQASSAQRAAELRGERNQQARARKEAEHAAEDAERRAEDAHDAQVAAERRAAALSAEHKNAGVARSALEHQLDMAEQQAADARRALGRQQAPDEREVDQVHGWQRILPARLRHPMEYKRAQSGSTPTAEAALRQTLAEANLDGAEMAAITPKETLEYARKESDVRMVRSDVAPGAGAGIITGRNVAVPHEDTSDQTSTPILLDREPRYIPEDGVIRKVHAAKHGKFVHKESDGLPKLNEEGYATGIRNAMADAADVLHIGGLRDSIRPHHEAYAVSSMSESQKRRLVREIQASTPTRVDEAQLLDELEA